MRSKQKIVLALQRRRVWSTTTSSSAAASPRYNMTWRIKEEQYLIAEHIIRDNRKSIILAGAASASTSTSTSTTLLKTSHRTFSTSSSSQEEAHQEQDFIKEGEEEATPKKSFTSAMRNLVKPFLLKCHPDVLASASSEDAKQVNLMAIQNLNAFLDSVQLRLQTPTASSRSRNNETTIFPVDFCILMEERVNGKKTELLCRRKVELSIPNNNNNNNNINNKIQDSSEVYIRHLEVHVEHELFKLLHIAGLQVPGASAFQQQSAMEEDFEQKWQRAVNSGDFSQLTTAEIARIRQEKWKRSRDDFTSRINWKQFQKVYNQTVQDIRANWMTQGLIRDDPNRRMNYLSEILSRVRVENEDQVDPILQIIALRRLSMILDDYFDELYLEELGKLWETTVIILTKARDYNVSPSALYRRRKQKTNKKGGEASVVNDGFSVTLHHDNSVTIHVPVDFRDEELISQLKRHTSDYYGLIGLGLDDYFPR